MLKIKEEHLLISPDMIKPSNKNLKVLGTFNPAAARLKNKDIILYVRVLERLIKDRDKDYYYSPRCTGKKECKIVLDKFKKSSAVSKSDLDFIFPEDTKRLTFISYLRRVILSEDGLNIKSIHSKPSFTGLENDSELGVEDPRITEIGGKYYMTYVSLSRQGNVSTSLVVSLDCLEWKRLGTIFREENKDVVILPEKINGLYFAFNRPHGSFEFSPPHIILSESKDLIHWGKPRHIALSKKGSWDYSKVGAGPPPIKTKKGWLLLYHGVTEETAKPKNVLELIEKMFGGKKHKSKYSVGAALFNLKTPWKLIAKSPRPIITPSQPYEQKGVVDNVVFPTGLVLDDEKKHLLVYSGGADTVVTVKKICLSEILDTLRDL